jgi:hypothetical protein
MGREISEFIEKKSTATSSLQAISVDRVLLYRKLKPKSSGKINSNEKLINDNNPAVNYCHIAKIV